MADPASATMYLVRHGATAENERQPIVLQGNGIDGPLSATGRRQAAAAAELLSAFGIAHVYCSPMRRARETASVIADRIGVQPVVLPRIHEIDVGDWEGLSWEQVAERFPQAYRQFLNHPNDVPYLGGESYADVLRRVQPEFERLLTTHVGTAFVVVAHNVVNRAYAAHLLGVDGIHAREIRQNNGGINVIRRQGDTTELLTLNSAFHVAGLGF